MKIYRIEMSFSGDSVVEDQDLSKLRYANVFIPREYEDVRKMMDRTLPREKIVGKLRIWRNYYETRVGCADWETLNLVVDFLRGN